MNDYIFGNFICKLREEKGYTQADVAKEMGVTPAAVSKWENGESKPRVDILFKLASMLDVSAEELIEGRRIPQQQLDPNAVKLISDRYEYLRRIDSHAKTSVKFKRILAFILDWNILGFAVLLLLALELYFFDANGLMSNPPQLPITICIPLTMLLYPVLVILRDFIFKGRSLGKRIMGLVILDLKTATKPKLSKTILRDIFFFLYQVDVIVMLVSGKSIGDYLAHTVVVNKKDIGTTLNSLTPINEQQINKEPNITPQYKTAQTQFKPDNTIEQTSSPTIQELNSYAPPKSKTKRNLAIVLGCIAVGFALLFCIVRLALEMSRNTVEYQLAYDYMINSELVAENGYTEKQIRYNKYSSQTYVGADGVAEHRTEVGFRIRFKNYSVILHKDESDNWYICNECTEFR